MTMVSEPATQIWPAFAAKGSKRWLQIAVNLAPEVINAELRSALDLRRGRGRIEWASPLQTDGFREYPDAVAYNKLGLPLSKRPLDKFWPARGPVWDGLATAGESVILLEAKAHVPELVSPRTRAGQPALGQIRESMVEVQEAIAPTSVGRVDWTGRFYQYTNRIAHLYFLRVENGVRAHLVNLYFLNADDVGGPSDRLEWEGALKVVNAYLGLGRNRLARYMHDVFIDVRDLQTAAETTTA